MGLFKIQNKINKFSIRIILLILLACCLIPQKMVNPVAGAGNNSWNHDTFWYFPWGQSGVHKGIDIFSKRGTPVVASQSGFVVYKRMVQRGGKVLVTLGPLFRFHYYAHLDGFNSNLGSYVSKNDTIGYIGNTGNAVNTPYHLHYSIFTPLPYIWRWSFSQKQGWKKMFFLNPGEKIQNNSYF